MYKENDLNVLKYFVSVFGLDEFFIEDSIIVPSKLSGGEKQKISISRSLIKNSSIIILDEPTSALDITSKNALLDYIESTKRDKIYIVISHDREVEQICDVVYDFSVKELCQL